MRPSSRPDAFGPGSGAPGPGPAPIGVASSAEHSARVELEAIFEEEAAQLELRRRELARARDLLGTLNLFGGRGESALEHLPLELAAGTVSQLLREAQGEMRNLVLVLDEGPALDEEAIRQAQARILAGHRHRTIYPAHSLDLPASVQWVRSWAAAGEDQRLLPSVQTEFAVFGQDAVVSVSRWGDLSSGYAISRHPLVVAVFSAYFDALWSQAQPMSVATGDHKDDARLLELLALGIKDEAIARLLGLGLRTVRRRIAGLMALHGVGTRYQLGLAIGSGRLDSR